MAHRRQSPPIIRSALLLGTIMAAIPFCASADDWPQWRGPTRDGVWRETGIVGSFTEDQLPIRWRAEVAGGYSGPTVAGSRVYLTDRLGKPDHLERVLCFDAATGRELWRQAYSCRYVDVGYTAGPRAAVSIADGRAFALGTMGHLHCLDAATGKILWKKTPGVDYDVRLPIWGIAASPLVDGDKVIVQVGAAGGRCLAAFDVATGREVWHALEDKASYSAPIIIEQAGQRVLVCWTGENVVGLDPATGRVHWSHPFPPHKMVINVPTPVREGNYLFLSAFYDGSLMLRLDDDRLSVEKLWRRRGASERDTDALHAMISTPYLEGEYVYGVDSYGQLRCLRSDNGDRVWEDLTATRPARWSNIHMVRNGRRMWMFNEQGELLIARLSPQGFEEIDRAKLIEPTKLQLNQRGGVCWSHPAFANRCVFARNDRELVCALLGAPDPAN